MPPRQQPYWQRYCINYRQQPSCPTRQRHYMDRRLAAGGGPITRFLDRIVAAETAEDVCKEGWEHCRAVVYATKVCQSPAAAFVSHPSEARHGLPPGRRRRSSHPVPRLDCGCQDSAGHLRGGSGTSPGHCLCRQGPLVDKKDSAEDDASDEKRNTGPIADSLHLGGQRRSPPAGPAAGQPLWPSEASGLRQVLLHPRADDFPTACGL